MAMTNAERQARHRARAKARVQELEALATAPPAHPVAEPPPVDLDTCRARYITAIKAAYPCPEQPRSAYLAAQTDRAVEIWGLLEEIGVGTEALQRGDARRNGLGRIRL